MNVLKNRHVVVAALVAPLLALMAYFGVDYLFGERPHAAVPGQSYPLVEKPGCRYAGGACGLKNADFELQVRFLPGADGRAVLRVESVFPLDGVVAALVSPVNAGEDAPRGLRHAEPGGRSWLIETDRPRAGQDRLRIVASAGGAQYFGEVSTAFDAEKAGTE